MSPAEEMRAAAKLLRETAKGATRGPWTQLPGAGNIWHFPADDCAMPTIVAEGSAVRTGDGAWITLVHPGLAEPLAEWLDAHGRDLASAGGTLADLSTCDSPSDVQSALALARVINGGEPR